MQPGPRRPLGPTQWHKRGFPVQSPLIRKLCFCVLGAIVEDGKQRRIEALRANNPNKLVDLTGRVFGRLTVIRRVIHQPKRTHWLCKCECGKEAIVWSPNLTKGQTQSCGCLQQQRTASANVERIKHGHTRHLAGKNSPVLATPTYTSWKSMLERCRNPNAPNYPLYGGRGITVCDQWQGPAGFATFFADMGERPEGRTLDRWPDKDGGYEPGNTRWATPVEQANNRRELSPENKAKQLETLAKGRGNKPKP